MLVVFGPPCTQNSFTEGYKDRSCFSKNHKRVNNVRLECNTVTRYYQTFLQKKYSIPYATQINGVISSMLTLHTLMGISECRSKASTHNSALTHDSNVYFLSLATLTFDLLTVE